MKRKPWSCAPARASALEARAGSLLAASDRPPLALPPPAGLYVMSPSRADFARFGALLASGAVAIEAYAEQDFLNEYYQVSVGIQR